MIQLKVRRQCLGLSQLQLAIETDLHQSRLCQIERGVLRPSQQEARHLAEFFRVPAATLLRPVTIRRRASVRHGEEATVSS